jgi:hypothetical protein
VEDSTLVSSIFGTISSFWSISRTSRGGCTLTPSRSVRRRHHQGPGFQSASGIKSVHLPWPSVSHSSVTQRPHLPFVLHRLAMTPIRRTSMSPIPPPRFHHLLRRSAPSSARRGWSSPPRRTPPCFLRSPHALAIWATCHHPTSRCPVPIAPPALALAPAPAPAPTPVPPTLPPLIPIYHLCFDAKACLWNVLPAAPSGSLSGTPSASPSTSPASAMRSPSRRSSAARPASPVPVRVRVGVGVARSPTSRASRRYAHGRPAILLRCLRRKWIRRRRQSWRGWGACPGVGAQADVDADADVADGDGGARFGTR